MKQSGATASLSTTGIAGPSGGSDEKPVGTVYLGCSVASETQIRGFRFSGTRDEIRELAAIRALQMMCYQLEGESVEMMCCQHGETIE
jgi:nicotinamide-nucleotide amidase